MDPGDLESINVLLDRDAELREVMYTLSNMVQGSFTDLPSEN
jgi:hypothetical protein